MEQRNIFLSVELCGPLYEKFIDYLDKCLGEELIGSLSLRRIPDEKSL